MLPEFRPPMFGLTQSSAESNQKRPLSFFSMHHELRHIIRPNYPVFVSLHHSQSSQMHQSVNYTVQDETNQLYPILTAACIVRVYGDISEDLRVNDIIEVIGILADSSEDESLLKREAMSSVSHHHHKQSKGKKRQSSSSSSSSASALEAEEQGRLTSDPVASGLDEETLKRLNGEEGTGSLSVGGEGGGRGGGGGSEGEEEEETNDAYHSEIIDSSQLPNIHALKIVTYSTHPSFTSSWIRNTSSPVPPSTLPPSATPLPYSSSSSSSSSTSSTSSTSTPSPFAQSSNPGVDRHRVTRILSVPPPLTHSLSTVMGSLHDSLLQILTHTMLGDKLAAEYLLLSLFARIFSREKGQTLGRCSLSLIVPPRDVISSTPPTPPSIISLCLLYPSSSSSSTTTSSSSPPSPRLIVTTAQNTLELWV